MAPKKRGKLEVLLVDAHGITHTNFIGSPVYYVLLQCGTKEYRSKMSKGDNDNALWNQKFVFDFPMYQWKKLTHIKVRIMDKELFKDGGFVGETIIHLGGIITEGRDRGYIEVKPAPYNVVLDDDTFKGELKLGFRFTAADKLHINKAWEVKIEGKNREEPMISPVLNLMKLPLLRFTAAWARTQGLINAELLYCSVVYKSNFLFVARDFSFLINHFTVS
ncbi:PREDICTED: elicitor-responsive protein 3-like [Brassica oleracea var. oleracea]|uniref:elicitor-responsive protein 3-like n=1 Tax=Brassica oleracea var. oleracea TaxID=109376 RepID=UPI0006A6E589|nr:PREDICTED: elicitor-responsive protein 3-like [Brassica oleracea var. oleracea]